MRGEGWGGGRWAACGARTCVVRANKYFRGGPPAGTNWIGRVLLNATPTDTSGEKGNHSLVLLFYSRASPRASRTCGVRFTLFQMLPSYACLCVGGWWSSPVSYVASTSVCRGGRESLFRSRLPRGPFPPHVFNLHLPRWLLIPEISRRRLKERTLTRSRCSCAAVIPATISVCWIIQTRSDT